MGIVEKEGNMDVQQFLNSIVLNYVDDDRKYGYYNCIIL